MSFGPPPSPYTQSALEGDRRRRRGRHLVMGVTAAVVAAACLAVWGLAEAGGGTSAGERRAAARQDPDDIRETVETPPKSVEGKAAFEYTEQIKEVGKKVGAPGTWATDKTFAKGFGNHIQGVAMDVPEEKKKDAKARTWKLTFPGPLCATTRHVSVAGWTAVAFSTEAAEPAAAPEVTMTRLCDGLALVDLDKGRKLWQAKLPGENPPTGVTVTMTDGAVALAWSQGSAAYDMTSGRRLWADTTPSACADEGFAGGRHLLALLNCGDSAAPTYQVQRIDPRSGRTKWTYRVARGVKDVYLVSSSPAVIAVAAGDDLVTDLISLDDGGRARARIPLIRQHQTVDCYKTFSPEVDSCHAIVVGERQVYIATDEDIVAFDLATGKSELKFDSPSGGQMYPIRMSGGKLIAYRESGGYSPSVFVAIDPATGREKLLLLFAESPDVDMQPLRDPTTGDVLYEHGRAYFAETSVDGPENKGQVGEIATVAVGIESVR
ncbi:PQQ-like beta-propeller repeat protein [Streptomyces sp. HUAS TT20]|uniref:PQQ-like beta-propeller repeat protein n=1 Tax=Streptomyces sp. HUAS TT20 TaxID=3447509 RepID=UPI0021D7F72B|nr:PQQ-like beta-propeller repeat protein [Streptomyces sp. HUAS 15-9]UXY30305.1 PQQ-like beta-propeller repeat protein [Streptomyces sp. HUAS 15-9]